MEVDRGFIFIVVLLSFDFIKNTIYTILRLILFIFFRLKIKKKEKIQKMQIFLLGLIRHFESQFKILKKKRFISTI
jgi:hypothetical protein